MKKINIIVGSLAVAVFLILLLSCEKTIQEASISPYTPINQDLNAGTWKTYVLNSPTEIPLAAPKASSSPEYLSELAELKASSAQLSQEQKKIVDYWGAGAVLRWNEIARELAAKYNLAPAANPDGSYPLPDANKPLTYPKFPFANPPYTARALAYMCVAQYDALVSTWAYKLQYNRLAPSKVDATVRNILPESSLPSYPSEDAVVAAASYTVLLGMFPGEVAYLESKLTEATNARLWAGANVVSDLSAGQELGKAVANKVMARAKTDGMALANNQTLTATFKNDAAARGIKNLWQSQESPIRPPMLPNFGAVATWHLDKPSLAAIRPVLPYVVGSSQWQKELDELSKINKNQSREQARIANYWADGAGSYTPPGHWHRTAANQAAAAQFSQVRMARTLALLGTTLMDAGIACWETKYYYYTPRPQQFGIKTSVGLPNFPSYTSGHSTFSAAAATVLGFVFPNKAAVFEAQAKEASESRVYGLIHFRIDCEMGLVHGKKIGNIAIEWAKADGADR
jgi:membrane-associated phospholipid phosphatase